MATRVHDLELRIWDRSQHFVLMRPRGNAIAIAIKQQYRTGYTRQHRPAVRAGHDRALLAQEGRRTCLLRHPPRDPKKLWILLSLGMEQKTDPLLHNPIELPTLNKLQITLTAGGLGGRVSRGERSQQRKTCDTPRRSAQDFESNKAAHAMCNQTELFRRCIKYTLGHRTDTVVVTLYRHASGRDLAERRQLFLKQELGAQLTGDKNNW